MVEGLPPKFPFFSDTGQLTAFENINKAGSDLSEKERDYNDIMQMRSEGMTYREIGDKMGFSESGIIKKIKRYEEILEKTRQQTKEINEHQQDLIFENQNEFTKK